MVVGRAPTLDLMVRPTVTHIQRQPFLWDGIWLRRDQILRLGYRPGEPYQIDGVWYWPIICPAALVSPGDICGGFRTRP